jgi:hypothetical protein
MHIFELDCGANQNYNFSLLKVFEYNVKLNTLIIIHFCNLNL